VATRPAWLTDAHRKLDEAVFAAYGWPSTLTDANSWSACSFESPGGSLFGAESEFWRCVRCKADVSRHFRHNRDMSVLPPPQTVAAQRLNGGVLIAFSSGEEGFYSDELLYASLPSAQDLLADALEQGQSPEPEL
jgi:hypothetical protein